SCEATTGVTSVKLKVPEPSGETVASYHSPPAHETILSRPSPGKPGGTKASAAWDLATPSGPRAMTLSGAVLPGLYCPSSFTGQREAKSTPPGPYSTPPSL